MARHFVAASSQYLQNTSAPGVSAPPLTLAIFFKPASISSVTGRLPIILEDKTNFHDGYYLQQFTSGGRNAVASGHTGWNGSANVTSLTTYTGGAREFILGSWNHAAAVFASNSSNKSYINGLLNSEDTTTVPAVSSTLSITLGRFSFNGTNYFDGDLAHAAVWDVALTLSEIAALAAWTLPTAIQPAHLIHYWPLAGTTSPEPDSGSGNRPLTVTGATAITDPTLAPAAPTPPTSTAMLINSTNVSATKRVRLTSIGIRDVLNEQPNTCEFRTGLSPATVGDVHVWYIAGATQAHLFGGTLIQPRQQYQLQPRNLEWNATAIDYTFLLNRRRPLARYELMSATSIVHDLVMRFTSGFYSSFVQAGLAQIPAITFNGQKEFAECLTQLASRIGAYWYVDYDRNLHFFVTETSAPPDDLNGAGNPLIDPPLTYEIDYSQIRSRVYVRGANFNVLSDTLANETIIPVESDIFDPAGGQLIAREYFVFSYTGRRLRTNGAVVGPGAQPSSVPVLEAVAGSGLSDGVYTYAYTFVTGSGESLPSPTAQVTAGTILNPTVAPTLIRNGPDSTVANMTIGATYDYVIAYSAGTTLNDHSAETQIGPALSVVAQQTTDSLNPTKTSDIVISVPMSSDARVTFIQIYRRENGGTYYRQQAYANVPGGSPNVDTDTFSNASLSGNPSPSGSNTAVIHKVNVSGIAVGASTVTSRKVYRTVANGSQLKLLTTIANNTATTYADTTADGSLGANVPTSDASGLTQPDGQTISGSTSIVVAGTGNFFSGGGWAEVGNQLLRYTGISGNTLTGIPASGPGSITTTIVWGAVINPAPSLTGVTGLTIPLYINAGAAEGSAVALWSQRDDTTAQAALAALEGGDGIHEHTIVDEGLTNLSACAVRGDAELALFSNPIITIKYSTFDVKTRSGKSVHVALASPTSLTGDFRIQDVSIDWLDVAGVIKPRFNVTASSVKFSLEDLLRRVVLSAA